MSKSPPLPGALFDLTASEYRCPGPNRSVVEVNEAVVAGFDIGHQRSVAAVSHLIDAVTGRNLCIHFRNLGAEPFQLARRLKEKGHD